MSHPAPKPKVVVLLPPSEESPHPFHQVTLRADDFEYVPVDQTGRHMVLRVTEDGTRVAEFEAALGAYVLDNHAGG